MTDQALVNKLLDDLERIGQVPTVAIQLSRELENPNVDATELADIIAQDPTLTSKILKLCNSSEYGFSRKIATMSEAVSILGHKKLKEIVFTILSHSFLNRPLTGYALEKGELWDNALTCANFSRHIADFVDFPQSELAYIAGLLKDIGKIALENSLNGISQQVETVSRQEKCAYNDAEDKVIGVSHTALGYQLATRWNFPDALGMAIGYHHRPSDLAVAHPGTAKDIIKLVAIVHLADSFTMMAGTGLGVDGLMYPLDMQAFEILSLKPDNQALERLYAELLDLAERIDSVQAAL